MAEKTNSVYELPIEEFEQRVLGLPPEKQRQEYQKWTQTQEKKQGGTNPLDFSFDQFEAYIAETNPSPQQQRFLYRKWMDKNTAGGKLKPKDKLPEGRERAEFLPVSKPEGKSVWEAGKSGELGWATPGSVIETGQAAGQALGTTEQLAKGRQAPVEDVEQAAWMGAGAAAGAGAMGSAPAGSSRIFAGRTAENFPRDRVKETLDRDVQGEPTWSTWMDTGVEYDADQLNPQFEINSKNLKLRNPQPDAYTDRELLSVLARQARQSPEGEVITTFEQAVDFPELYESYPTLKNLKISFTERLPKETMGGFDPKEGEVFINARLLNDPEQLYDTLTHEIQHVIQKVEGWEGGANKNKVFQAVPGLKEISNEFNERFSQLEEQLDGLYETQPDGSRFLKEGVDTKKATELYSNYLNAKADLNEVNKTVYNYYQGNLGEIEARAAAMRRQMTDQEKAETAPSITKSMAFNEMLKEKFKDKVRTNGQFNSDLIEALDEELAMEQAQGGAN